MVSLVHKQCSHIIITGGLPSGQVVGTSTSNAGGGVQVQPLDWGAGVSHVLHGQKKQNIKQK